MPAGYRTQPHEVQCLDTSTTYTLTSVQGMSPKKLHEVSAMTAHIAHLLRTSPALNGVQHVVDIGAGQVTVPFALIPPPSEKK